MWTKKWIIANWKMHGSLAENQQRLQNYVPQLATFVAVCPPFPYLTQLSAYPKIAIGAQDVSQFATGAYTGDVAAAMLADCQVKVVLVGHSERRAYAGDNNEIIAAKMAQCLAHKLIPILCVGENASERQAGQAEAVVRRQLEVLRPLGMSQIAVAYEPVWAIGTGVVASLEQISMMHQMIYQEILSMASDGVSIRLLYGGSVNASNARDILAADGVDGALVGSASLNADDFNQIIQSAIQ